MPKNLSEEQQKALEERKAEADALRIEYRKLEKNPAFMDIVAKAKMLAEISTRAAIDGVGYDAQGHQVDISPDKASRLLGEAAGLQKLVAYVDRQLTTLTPSSQKD